nr:putative transposase (putative), gypsy type [Tanacetum cinerariifolium]
MTQKKGCSDLQDERCSGLQLGLYARFISLGIVSRSDKRPRLLDWGDMMTYSMSRPGPLTIKLSCMPEEVAASCAGGYEKSEVYKKGRLMTMEQEAGEEYPPVLYQALGLSQKLEQPLFWVDERVFPIFVDWRTSAPKDWMPAENTYFVKAVRTLDTHHIDLLSLIRAPNPTKVKTRSRPRVAREVPLLTVTANRVIEMEDPATVTDSSGVPSTIERSPSDFATEAGAEDQGTVALEVPPPEDGTATAGDPESENASFAFVVGSPESIYRPEWGIANGSMLDTPEACQDLVAMGSQLRLRFEQEAKLLKKSVAQVARRDKRIQAREQEIKNLEALLEAEADMKKAAEDKSAKLSQELENMRALFSDLQVSNNHLSQQVATLQEQVSGEEKLKAAFEEFKQCEDNRVEQPIAGRRWMIGHGLCLAVVKCSESLELRQAFADVVSAGIAKGMSEGLRHGVEHGRAQLDLESLEAYDPEAKAKYIAALQVLKNLKYPLVDQLEGLKDVPMDVIMAALYLESDTGDDAPQWVRELRPSSSQPTIPVYLVVRDPLNPWACKEEMLLADAIATNGLAILLADAATQTKSDEAFQLPRSSSLPTMHS